MGTIAVAVVSATLVALWMGGVLTRLVRQLMEGLDNWRGGSPPTHPMPANDGAIVLRRRRREPEL